METACSFLLKHSIHPSKSTWTYSVLFSRLFDFKGSIVLITRRKKKQYSLYQIYAVLVIITYNSCLIACFGTKLRPDSWNIARWIGGKMRNASRQFIAEIVTTLLYVGHFVYFSSAVSSSSLHMPVWFILFNCFHELTKQVQKWMLEFHSLKIQHSTNF